MEFYFVLMPNPEQEGTFYIKGKNLIFCKHSPFCSHCGRKVYFGNK
jgi:hypothetical protein